MLRISRNTTSPAAYAPPVIALPATRTAPPPQERPRLSSRRRVAHDYLLGEDLFRAALDRELKRVDRFDEVFALVEITPNRACDQAVWSEMIDVLTLSKLDIDIVGWLVQDRTIGLIRPLVHLEPTEAAATIGTTVQRELARVLSRQGAACAIRVEVFSPESDHVALPRRAKTRRQKMTEAATEVSKRTLDIAGSLALLTLFAPVFLVVSGLVRFSSTGPILFRQVRVGRNGEPFTMLKFRTMHVNSDQRVHEQYVAHLIQAGAAAQSHGGVFKIVNDRRVTPVGHFLRRASLDELPQFWNVLRGEMSLVGPRPPLPYEVARYKRWHRRRLSAAKPGITGLWQVSARSRATFDEMVRLDLQYARECSLWTDIRILLATPRAVFSGKGAH